MHVVVLEAADSRCDLRHFALQRVGETALSMRHHMQRLVVCVDLLHQQGLVHTQLSPANFLRFGGKWKLLGKASP